jgi:NAD(P)-dependent dehydrogenase (short-subunit alcohol dehydrogenase family)
MSTSVLSNKTWIVTGAGRGIGRAIALRLGAEHANVVVSARTSSEIARVAEEIEALGGRALPVVADVSDESSVGNLVQAAAERFAAVDGLVNNAGIGSFTPVASMATEDFDRMWGVNMRGVFLCTRAVLPHMTRQSSGDIVNIASLAGRNAFAGGAGYAATKWALIGFSRCLMLEVRERNIRVITLCPGSVDTTFNGPSAHGKNASAIPSADAIASVALDALRMPRNTMVSEIDIRPTNPKG